MTARPIAAHRKCGLGGEEETENMSPFRSCDSSETRSATDAGECPAGEHGWHSDDISFLPGDFFGLVREPENPVDPSAMAVHDSCGQRLGYLTPQQSILLAPFIDCLPINVVGRVLSLTEPGDDLKLASSKPEVIVSVFTHPEICGGTPDHAMRYDRR
jgi:hypothetical protein